MNSRYSNEVNDLSNTNTKSVGELFYFVVFIKKTAVHTTMHTAINGYLTRIT